MSQHSDKPIKKTFDKISQSKQSYTIKTGGVTGPQQSPKADILKSQSPPTPNEDLENLIAINNSSRTNTQESAQ